MGLIDMNELGIEQVRIKDAAEFDGYHIIFTIDAQTFQFLVGNKQRPIPLGVKHIFNKKQTCKLCGKKVNAVPVGQQLCSSLQTNRLSLLQYFQEYYDF